MESKTQEQEVQKVEIRKWMKPIKRKLKTLNKRQSILSIFNVPNTLRKADEDVYSPGIVSLGPFHSTTTTTSSLQQTPADKWRHMLSLLQQTPADKVVAEDDDKWRHMLSLLQQTLADKVVAEDDDKWRHMLSLLQKTLADKVVAEDDDKWRHILSLLQQTLVKKNDHLQAMEEHKWWYTVYLIHRTPNAEKSNPKEILIKCGTAILNLDENVRGSYAANIKHNNYELAEIMLIDGCFILELLMRSWWPACPCKGKKDGDYIFHNTLMVTTLQQDLALLENQIPFCILEDLYEIVKDLHTPEHGHPMPSIAELALHFFHPELKSNWNFREKCSKAGEDCKHLLDLLHNFYLPAPPPEANPEGNKDLEANREKGQESWGFKKGVTSLSEAGTVFKKAAKADHLLGIEYDEGIIKIPQLCINEKTESLLRNLIAFEQCSGGNKYHVSSYVILLKSLIRSSQDVELLRQKGIITHSLVGDENVLIFFNNISRKIKAKNFCFGNLCEKVEADEKSWWHWNRIKAFCEVRSLTYWKVLKSDYFSTPWSFISFIAALVLLVLTIIQTYYSVRSYLHPH